MFLITGLNQSPKYDWKNSAQAMWAAVFQFQDKLTSKKMNLGIISRYRITHNR